MLLPDGGQRLLTEAATMGTRTIPRRQHTVDQARDTRGLAGAEPSLSALSPPDKPYRVLKNPLTSEYQELKEWVLSSACPWQRQGHTGLADGLTHRWDQLPVMNHVILDRPEDLDGVHVCNNAHPLRASDKEALAYKVLDQICLANNFGYEPHRICFNLTKASKARHSVIHRDHEFPHWNMIIYLTEFHGGWTYVHGEQVTEKSPDAIVIFDGSGQKHMHEPPEGIDDNRIVLIMTYTPHDRFGGNHDRR